MIILSSNPQSFAASTQGHIRFCRYSLKRLLHALETSLCKSKIWRKMNCNSGKSTKQSFARPAPSKEVQAQTQVSWSRQLAARTNRKRMWARTLKVAFCVLRLRILSTFLSDSSLSSPTLRPTWDSFKKCKANTYSLWSSAHLSSQSISLPWLLWLSKGIHMSFLASTFTKRS